MKLYCPGSDLLINDIISLPDHLIIYISAMQLASLSLKIEITVLGPELLVCCLAYRGPAGVFLLRRS